MPYRINGTGTTIAPMPVEGEYTITMHWFTFFFIPLIPLGWQLVKGTALEKYFVIRKLSYKEVKSTIGIRGMILTILYGYYVNLIILGLFLMGSLLIFWVRSF